MKQGANSIDQARIKQLAEGRPEDPAKGLEAIEPQSAQAISQALQIKLDVVEAFMPKPKPTAKTTRAKSDG